MKDHAGWRPFRFFSLVSWLRSFSARIGFGWGRNLRLGDSYRLGSGKVRVPLAGVPLELSLGLNDRRLHIYPETRLNARSEASWLGTFIIVDPRVHLRRITGFLRLQQKQWLSLGSGDPLQQLLFDYPPEVAAQHLVVIHGRDALVFRSLSDAGAGIGPTLNQPTAIRIRRLRRLRDIFGGPVALLGREEAVRLIHQVNDLLLEEEYRPRDDRGLPGGLLVLPDHLTPILVADLHAQVDNLLTVLSQNAFLDALEEGSAVLVILGDAAHNELDGQLREMRGSMLLMDLIFRLKVRFPKQVFYLRGNHDSFSEDIAKDGIPQGLLWAKELGEQRGTAYLKAMSEFYRRIPYVVFSYHFLACHAAAPKTKTSPEMVVQIHRYPELVPQLINNRLHRANRPQGYNRRDVKRFRRAFQLTPETPFIVGHTPLDREETVWLNVDAIRNHHLLFSAHPERVGVFTRVGNTMIPLVYAVDAATAIINALPERSE